MRSASAPPSRLLPTLDRSILECGTLLGEGCASGGYPQILHNSWLNLLEARLAHPLSFGQELGTHHLAKG
jgi:hypothetical protein